MVFNRTSKTTLIEEYFSFLLDPLKKNCVATLTGQKFVFSSTWHFGGCLVGEITLIIITLLGYHNDVLFLIGYVKRYILLKGDFQKCNLLGDKYLISRDMRTATLFKICGTSNSSPGTAILMIMVIPVLEPPLTFITYSVDR